MGAQAHFGRRVDWRVFTTPGGYSLVNTGWGRARRVTVLADEGVELLSWHWADAFETLPGQSWVFTVMPPSPDLAQGWHLVVRWGLWRRREYVPMPSQVTR